MISDLLAPQSLPFAIALGLMLLIAVTEIIGMLIGLAPSGALDNMLPDIDVEADADLDAVDASSGALSQVLGWLCIGKVPALVLLVAFLSSFGLSGLIMQSLVHGVTGFYIPALLAIVPAFFLALPFTRYIALGLSKLMPKEETEAVSQKTFIGKVATIIRGEARQGLAAEAKITDSHGMTHYVRIEPDIAEEIFEQGSKVLIVSAHGSIYRAIKNDSEILSQ